jgi:pantoate--beta-alanine ligase
LSSAQSSEEAIALLEDAGFEMEYVEEEDGRRFGAVTLEGVRLIDNWKLAVAAPR